MKTKFFTLMFICSSLLAFKISDEVELDAYLNARTSPVFYKYTKNVKTTLSPGTKGKVVEVTKTFPTGNQGIKIQISSGPKAGQNYWVYFDKKNPALKLTDENRDEVKKPDQAKKAEVVREVAAQRDMEEHALVETVKAAMESDNSEVTSQMTKQQNPCPAIAPGIPPALEEVKKTDVEVIPEIAKDSSVVPFERTEPRQKGGCTSQRSTDGYSNVNIIDCKTSEVLYSGGYTFHNGPGHPYLTGVSSAYEDAGTPGRAVEFVSRDKALNDTFVYLTDVAGGPDSHDVKSVMVILPRKGVPTTEVVGEDVIVTLTTGEKVIFDKKSNAIKSGAMKEGPIDLTTDRFKRTPPNVHYTGSGISIRVDHRFEYPTMGAATAEVRQGDKVCKVPKAKIWDKEGNPLTSDDQSLLKILIGSCPGKGFKL
jgi:hypothetical protein